MRFPNEARDYNKEANGGENITDDSASRDCESVVKEPPRPGSFARSKKRNTAGIYFWIRSKTPRPRRSLVRICVLFFLKNFKCRSCFNEKWVFCWYLIYLKLYKQIKHSVSASRYRLTMLRRASRFSHVLARVYTRDKRSLSPRSSRLYDCSRWAKSKALCRLFTAEFLRYLEYAPWQMTTLWWRVT